MPFLGLALFWFLPFWIATPLYALDLALSLGVYVLVIKALRRPVVSGFEGMIGARVEALEPFASEGRVRYGAEIWNACSDVPVRKGQELRISAVRGLSLVVSGAPASETSPVSTLFSCHGKKG